MALTIAEVCDEASITFSVSGGLTFTALPVMRDVADKISTRKFMSVTICLKDVNFIDSAGIGVLIELQEIADSVGSRLIIESPKGQVKRGLLLAKLYGVLRIVDAETYQNVGQSAGCPG